MDPTASDPRDNPERAPAQRLESEGGEHVRFAPSAQVTRTGSRPTAAYQYEDDELAPPIE